MAEEVKVIGEGVRAVSSSDISLIGLVLQADIIVQSVMILLLLASFWSWAIIFTKWRKFRTVGLNTEKFERLFRASDDAMLLYQKLKQRHGNPMAEMFVSGVKQLLSCHERKVDARVVAKERIFHRVQNSKNHAVEAMEKDLVVLATVGSSAPFVGLFGTVWGIMHSFQSIAATKNTTLAVVAPGIAEALLATALGLFAAIPAAMFYNIYGNHIRMISSKLDDFCDELSALLSHQVGSKG